jgi:chromosome segregation ATPase
MGLAASRLVLQHELEKRNADLSRFQVQVDLAEANLRTVGWSLSSSANEIRAARLRLKVIRHLWTENRKRVRAVEKEIARLEKYAP